MFLKISEGAIAGLPIPMVARLH